jgi:beta-1,4-mannosyl-glycoprotein beta-1,4-N-acetylglucosaminyltransferase
MRVFDGVLYNGEADVLECRLLELADTVDKFVIVEGDKTFTGKSRVRGDRTRFESWAEKIHWVDFVTPTASNAWHVEAATRNQLFVEFARLGVSDVDVVTVCDADEIWSPSSVEQFGVGWHGMLMRHLVFSVFWEAPLELTAVAGPWGLRQADADVIRRQHRYSLPNIVSGWHVAWMGGPAWCAEKIRQFSHQEYNVGDLDARMAACFRDGVFIDGLRLSEVEVAADWPRWIREGRHPESWRWRR